MGQSTPIGIAGHSYDPETIDLLQSLLNEIWTGLADAQRNSLPRSVIAERLLQAAAAGERDRHALRAFALDQSKSASESVFDTPKFALDEPKDSDSAADLD